MAKLKLYILVLAAAVVALFWLTRKPQQTSWVLPDGSVLSVAKVTSGPDHVLRYGYPWLNRLSPILPAVWRSKVQFRTATFQSRTNEFVIWMHRTRARQGPAPLPYQLAVFEENGLEMPLPRNIAIVAADGEITGSVLRSYPHRAAVLGIRIYLPPSESPVGQFTFPNRVARESPQWKPDPTPTPRSMDPLEVTLLKLESGVCVPGPGPISGINRRGARATFVIKAAGVISRDWSVTRLVATSATGEQHVSTPGYWSDDVQVVDFYDPLWLDEPAWKLRTEVSRATNYLPGETWTWTGLAAPGTKQLTEGGLVTNLFMTELEFQGISSPGAFIPSRCVAMKGCWNAHLRTPYPLDDWKVSLVEIRDQAGHVAHLKGKRSATSDGGRGITPRELIYGFGFDLPQDAQTLELTFAITQNRIFEFQAKPALARSGKGVERSKNVPSPAPPD